MKKVIDERPSVALGTDENAVIHVLDDVERSVSLIIGAAVLAARFGAVEQDADGSSDIGPGRIPDNDATVHVRPIRRLITVYVRRSYVDCARRRTGNGVINLGFVAIERGLVPVKTNYGGRRITGELLEVRVGREIERRLRTDVDGSLDAVHAGRNKYGTVRTETSIKCGRIICRPIGDRAARSDVDRPPSRILEIWILAGKAQYRIEVKHLRVVRAEQKAAGRGDLKTHVVPGSVSRGIDAGLDVGRRAPRGRSYVIRRESA